MTHAVIRHHRIGCRSVAICLLSMLFLGGLDNAAAQQPTKIPRIGYLTADTISSSHRVEAFRGGLHDMGYVEGKNIVIEWRSVEGNLERIAALAEELVRLKVDVIVASAQSVTGSAKRATSTIPIVMANDIDPVGNGFVASLAQPGGNVTGLSSLAPELSGKRLELLKEIIPKLSRVSVLGTSSMPGNILLAKAMEQAAPAVGVKYRYIDVLDPKDIEPAFRAATKERAEAILVMQSFFLFGHRARVAELAVKHRLPAIYGSSEFVDAGGLISYGVHFPDLYHCAATYVDKILKGRKPADLPVEQPVKFEFVINLKAAKQIGLTIPPNVLVRADKVIR